MLPRCVPMQISPFFYIYFHIYKFCRIRVVREIRSTKNFVAVQSSRFTKSDRIKKSTRKIEVTNFLISFLVFHSGRITWIAFSNLGFADRNCRVFSLRISRAPATCTRTTWSVSVERIRFRVPYNSFKCDSRTWKAKTSRQKFEFWPGSIGYSIFYLRYRKR